MLEELMGGEDGEKCGMRFSSIVTGKNVHNFPYYRALSKQVHWFMMCRKVMVHKKEIEKANEAIAKHDRDLWTAELQ